MYANNCRHRFNAQNRALHLVPTIHLRVSVILTVNSHVFALERGSNALLGSRTYVLNFDRLLQLN
jgi:hypothetical protein